jgi:hypothetical protein
MTLGREKSAILLRQPIGALLPSEEVYSKVPQMDTSIVTLKIILNNTN